MAIISAAVTTATPVNSTVSSGSVTAAGDVPTGSSVIAVLFGKYSTLPTFGSFTAAGNTFTVVKQDLATNDIVIGYCSSTTHAITGGSTTYGWSMSSGSMTEANFIVVPFDQPLSAPASMTITQVSATVADSASLTPTASGTTGLFIFGDFGAATGAVKSGDGTGFFFSGTNTRGLAVGYISPTTSTATLTQNIDWTATNHTVMHTSGEFTVSVSSLDLTGQDGTFGFGVSRYGTLTKTDATISSIAGKKTAVGFGVARPGQLTLDLSSFGGFGQGVSRFGVLDAAVATTAFTGIKGATALGVTRFGVLSENTLGNLFLAGSRKAVSFGDSRFGAISVVGEWIDGALTAVAIADARAGFLLLHNRTPGVVTVRAENKGLVTIRIGD